jgi:hypothetical protein
MSSIRRAEATESAEPWDLALRRMLLRELRELVNWGMVVS